MSEFNDRVIAQYRATGGRVQGFGDSLVLIHSVGARSGKERVNPALSLPDGNDWLVIASAAGAARNPGWYHNLRAQPDVTIEVGTDWIPVTAHELGGSEHEQAFARFVAASPAFSQYQQRAGSRRLPIFRLIRRR